MSTFAQPAVGGGYFKPRDHEGHLILITRAIEKIRRFDPMKGKEGDEVLVDLVDLDGDGVLKESVWMTHAVLVKSVKTDQPTLGRIASQKFNNGNTGFILTKFEEGVDDVKAQQWLNDNPDVDMTPVPGAGNVKAEAPQAQQPQQAYAPAGGGRMTLDAMRAGGNTTVNATPLSRPDASAGFDINGMDDQQRAALLAALNQTGGQQPFGGSAFTSEPPF